MKEAKCIQPKTLRISAIHPPHTLIFATFILSLKAQSSHFSLNSTLPSPCSFCLSYYNQTHFTSLFSQALQGPPSLVVEKHIPNIHLAPFSSFKGGDLLHPFNSSTSKAFCGCDSNSILCMFQVVELLSFS